MKLIIDADASPVQQEVMDIANRYKLEVIIVKSYSHFSPDELPSHVSVQYVDKGAEMADYKIIALAQKGDVIITQDYGLASVVLGKGCYAVHHKGFQYTDKNIEQLLASRHANAMARRGGYRTKGPKPFTKEDRTVFSTRFERFINQIITDEESTS